MKEIRVTPRQMSAALRKTFAEWQANDPTIWEPGFEPPPPPPPPVVLIQLNGKWGSR